MLGVAAILFGLIVASVGFALLTIAVVGRFLGTSNQLVYVQPERKIFQRQEPIYVQPPKHPAVDDEPLHGGFSVEPDSSKEGPPPWPEYYQTPKAPAPRQPPAKVYAPLPKAQAPQATGNGKAGKFFSDAGKLLFVLAFFFGCVIFGGKFIPVQYLGGIACFSAIALLVILFGIPFSSTLKRRRGQG